MFLQNSHNVYLFDTAQYSKGLVRNIISYEDRNFYINRLRCQHF